MTAKVAHPSSRLRAVGLSMVAACAIGLARPAPPPRTLDGLAGMLGHAAHGIVLRSEVLWEPSRGVVGEALLGRHVLFLARAEAGKERDLYGARVRLSAEGQPIEVVGLRNISETPLGDDSGLEVRGASAVFATTAYGRVQGVTLLDLQGVPSRDRPSSLAGRVTLALASFR